MNKIKDFFIDLFQFKEKKERKFDLTEKPTENNNEDLVQDTLPPLTDVNQSIYNSLSVNLEYIKNKYNLDINTDIKVREFNLTARNKQYSAFLLYIDGLVDSDLINRFMLDPLMLKNKANTFDGSEEVVSTAISNNISVKRIRKFNLDDYIYNTLMPQNAVDKYDSFEKVFSAVNLGACALFVDTLNVAYVSEMKKFDKRSIGPSQNETVIRGSQEAFIESIRTNTSLLRRLVNNENLVIESTTVGTITKTQCAICYINNLTNMDLVEEVKYRLNNLSIDYLTSSGQLEQLIEDNPNSSLPQVVATERPDKSATYLLDGRVVIIVNGSPYALVVPGVFFDFMSSMEDSNLNYKFANLLKVVRLFGLVISLLLPGLYMAITNFHQELIPTELLFSIVSTRSTVPFPILVEILLMELSLELIREAGIRVPSPLGQTIGIIGGLVLSEAAVSANIVSPILIIIVAITGLSSFTLPDFSLSFHVRLTRFAYIFLGYFGGFLGISLGLFVHFAILANLQSFGISYLAPYIPVTHKRGNEYFVQPIWKKEKRMDVLNPQRIRKEEDISAKWKSI